MAKFKINIENIPPTYNRLTTVKSKEDCDIINERYPVAISGGTEYKLISNYIGNTWKTLVITGVNAYNSNFKLAYNGVDITQLDLPLSIDITTIVDGNYLPNLDVRYDKIPSGTDNIIIYFYILDSNNVAGPTLNSSFQVQAVDCIIEVPQPTISNVVNSLNNETDIVDFTITADVNTTYKYQIIQLEYPQTSYGSSLKNTDDDTSLTSQPLFGEESIIAEYTTNASGIINLKWTITVRSPKFDKIPNCCRVVLQLFKADGITPNPTEKVELFACFNYGGLLLAI